MVSFLFPGQGSQSPGMGQALAEAYPQAKEVFQEADDTLGMNLSKLCFEGPEEDLKRTEITQPAILTTSIAALRAVQAERPEIVPNYVAGHSLGEWSALVAAGALSFKDAVRLAHKRGQLMQQAVPQGEGAMLAVVGLAPEKIAEICLKVAEADDDVVAPANFNSPEQTVISGSAAAVAKVEPLLNEAGAKKLVALAVSAPFHCDLILPAAEGLDAELADVTISEFSTPVIQNVTAKPSTDHKMVREMLVQQVTASVRWVESMKALAETGETLTLELGPGKVLMGLMRRIDRKVKVLPVGDTKSLGKALETLPA